MCFPLLQCETAQSLTDRRGGDAGEGGLAPLERAAEQCRLVFSVLFCLPGFALFFVWGRKADIIIPSVGTDSRMCSLPCILTVELRWF